jgi:hypothetical protein
MKAKPKRLSLLFVVISLLFCCKKNTPFNSPANQCVCSKTSDTNCAHYPDTILAKQLIQGKWYLREVDYAADDKDGTWTTVCMCDSSMYLTFFSNDSVLIGPWLGIPAEMKPYLLINDNDWNYPSNFIADKYTIIDTNINYIFGAAISNSSGAPMTICDSLLIISAHGGMGGGGNNVNNYIYRRY